MSETISLKVETQSDGRSIRPSSVARARQDQTAKRTFFIVTLLPVILIVMITIALFLRALPILNAHPFTQLLFGDVWKPSAGLFGFKPFILGTVWVTAVGVLLAVPPSLLVAIYLAEYAHTMTRSVAKPILDLLAAIPPVVYGVWGLLAIVPFVQGVLAPLSDRWLDSIPLFAINQPTGFGILAAGIVLAVMIAPLIISVVYEVFSTVPNELRNASLAVGATRWQTIRRIVLPQILPGIIAAIVLAASRAFGETIAVLIVVGNVANIPTSIFDSAYPLPALIANNYGDMMSIPLYDAALLGAALILLVVILIFNVISTLVLQRLKRRSWA
ncbi:MAG: phosphate ABC transporter permease subunit PstC [Anaerolineales bacterium]|nr:phosphate ABC transporter permease subunit PstC [Anaerolineae bacterium]PWB69901.1 MAG: phosphate ABC transporter permease subunit PstC [Anaerolineales bacterium]